MVCEYFLPLYRLSFHSANVSCFTFAAYAFSVMTKKIIAKTNVKKFFPCFLLVVLQLELFHLIFFFIIFIITLLEMSSYPPICLPPPSPTPFPLAITTLLSMSMGYAYMFFGWPLFLFLFCTHTLLTAVSLFHVSMPLFLFCSSIFFIRFHI